MTTRNGNIKGIKFLESPRGPDHEGLLIVTFDLLFTAFTGGTDTIQLGGGGTENGQPTVLTLAQMIANRRRDGRTWTLGQIIGASPGRQLSATNGPDFWAQSAVLSGGNITSIVLMSAPTGGSNITTTIAAWDAACELQLTALASGN